MESLYCEISSIAALLCERGWAERNAGNFSIRLEEMPALPGPRRYMLPMVLSDVWTEETILLVTAAGIRMRELKDRPRDGIMVLRFHQGQQEAMLYGPSGLEPSTELITHLMVNTTLLKDQPDQKALLHAHVTDLIAMTHHPDLSEDQGLNDALMRMHAETLFFLPEGIAILPFGVPGSMELAKNTAMAFQVRKVCVWPKHGALACGPTITEAFDRLDIVAKAARLWLMCKSAGFSPQGLNPAELHALRHAYGID